MDFLELFYCVVRIDLRCGQVLVAEQLLYGHEARTLIEEMGGEGVAQDMRAFLLQRGDAVKQMVHLIIYKGGRHLSSPVVQEQPFGLFREGGIAQRLILHYQLYHLR